MWTITQGDDGWQVWHDGTATGDPAAGYPEAVATMAAAALADDSAGEGGQPGALGELWHSPAGIAFSEATGDGRDFTSVAWSWRDPATSLLPLMFQDQTDMGHFGAKLAGYLTQVGNEGGVLHAEGAFYDSEQGRAARDLLLGGRHFGVSVDPGAVDATWECVAEDDDGWCTEERITFQSYEVIGLTMTPFPAFANAAIELAGAGSGELAVAAADHAFTDDNGDGRCDACLAEDEDGNCTEVCDLTEAEHEAAPAPPPPPPASIITAARPIPAAPPAEWFTWPEPRPGDPHMVEQKDGTWACPLTISDDGQVYGHVAPWGTCHVGYPGVCVTAPTSRSDYREFNLGLVRSAEGSDTTTGPLTVGADHAPDYLGASGARDHYAHTGLAWADVHVTNGVHGAWAAGALRPSVTPELLRVLRASTLSGDWRDDELIGVLAVNTPGFPIHREALVAAGVMHMPAARPHARVTGGKVRTLVAVGQVRRCADCAEAERRDALGMRGVGVVRDAVTEALGPLLTEVAALRAAMDKVEGRTRHLRSAEADHMRARLTASRR